MDNNRRIASQVMYSGLIAVLGDSWPQSIYNLLHDPNTSLQGQVIKDVHIRPSLMTAAVIMTAVLFSAATVFSGYSQFLLDK